MTNYEYGKDALKAHPGIEVTVETITPETARLMLAHNTHNRDAGKRTGFAKFDQLTKAMADGTFEFNGATITFAGDGTLLDGQHRLMACLSSGVPFDTVVVRGLPVSSQDTMDTGKKRSLANVLQIKGMKNTNTLASAAPFLLSISKYGLDEVYRSNHALGITQAEAVRFAERSVLLNDCVQDAQNLSKRIMTPKNGAVLRYILRVIDREDADFFFDDLLSIQPERQPIALLRSKLMAERAATKTKNTKPMVQAAYIIKAWNAYRNGETVKNYSIRLGGLHAEQFPEPDGFDHDALAARIKADMYGRDA